MKRLADKPESQFFTFTGVLSTDYGNTASFLLVRDTGRQVYMYYITDKQKIESELMLFNKGRLLDIV